MPTHPRDGRAVTGRRPPPSAPAYVRFTPYEDLRAELQIDPEQLLTETATLLAEMRGLFGAASGATGDDPQTVTIPAQQLQPPAPAKATPAGRSPR